MGEEPSCHAIVLIGNGDAKQLAMSGRMNNINCSRTPTEGRRVVGLQFVLNFFSSIDLKGTFDSKEYHKNFVGFSPFEIIPMCTIGFIGLVSFRMHDNVSYRIVLYYILEGKIHSNLMLQFLCISLSLTLLEEISCRFDSTRHGIRIMYIFFIPMF
jgi:hypothetical protein